MKREKKQKKGKNGGNEWRIMGARERTFKGESGDDWKSGSKMRIAKEKA